MGGGPTLKNKNFRVKMSWKINRAAANSTNPRNSGREIKKVEGPRNLSSTKTLQAVRQHDSL